MQVCLSFLVMWTSCYDSCAESETSAESEASAEGLALASFLVSFPDPVFCTCRKNRSGELPVPFLFKCAGMLAHCSFLI